MSIAQSIYKPLRRMKRGNKFRFYREQQVWVIGHKVGSLVHIHKVEDVKQSVSYCAKMTDTAEVIV